MLLSIHLPASITLDARGTDGPILWVFFALHKSFLRERSRYLVPAEVIGDILVAAEHIRVAAIVNNVHHPSVVGMNDLLNAPLVMLGFFLFDRFNCR